MVNGNSAIKCKISKFVFPKPVFIWWIWEFIELLKAISQGVVKLYVCSNLSEIGWTGVVLNCGVFYYQYRDVWISIWKCVGTILILIQLLHSIVDFQFQTVKLIFKSWWLGLYREISTVWNRSVRIIYGFDIHDRVLIKWK